MADPQEKQTVQQKPEESGKTKDLSAEEQMERFEEDLKENDWGHQPC